MEKNLNKNRILVTTTKPITFNRFLYPICDKLDKELNLEIIVGSSYLNELDSRWSKFEQFEIYD